MQKKIFVTGASGFLACHIILQLLKSGASVTGSVRSMAKADHITTVLQNHGADTSRLNFVELDLLSDKGWDEAMAGHGYLIHTASPFVTTMPKDPDLLVKPAVEGTARALGAAFKAGVKHIALTSSVVAVAHGHASDHTDKLTENDWTNIDGPDVTPYILSKTLAEKKAWEMVGEANKKDILTVINPGFILGPVLEDDIGTSGALIHKMLSGGFPGSPNLCFSCVDVRDAASMHINALTDAEFAGRRVLAAGVPIQLVDIARALATEFPEFARKLPTRQIPDFVVKIIALFDGDAKTAATSLGRKHAVDSAPSVKLLGHDLITNEKAACDMARSIIDRGLVN